MKIYTKTGDKGMTSLLTGERVPKDSLRVETYGTVDELNAVLGLARAAAGKAKVRDAILKVQKMLMAMMGELAGEPAAAAIITAEHITALETLIDQFTADLAPLTHFIVPGDNQSSACLHMARTVARRAERLAWRLARQEQVHEAVLIALNRLSDLCFTLARYEAEVD